MNAASLALLAQCLLGVAAMACLSVAMERHARQVASHFNYPIKRTPLRWAGWTLLTIMVMTTVTNQGWGQGLTCVLGALSFSAVVVIGLLTYRPQWLIHVALLGVVGGLSILGATL